MDAKKYLLDIGFDDAHLPNLFNDDDKSQYTIPELMESYHQFETSKMFNDFIEEKNRLKEICKNLIYSIDGEFVSKQLSDAAESAEEELQLMELNK